ncbi:hypothetical protein ACQ3G6_04740 [Allorhizobium undicola]|uniref:hypothetical protein n=1 Tax=Allorhizobium undicola TaxID=78527 RepID=UPI0004885B6E|nr:hypothetical protein [Allorhizobium undicola]
MADIVRIMDRLGQRSGKTSSFEGQKKSDEARILLFTGVRYIREEPRLIGAPALTGKYTPEYHPS